MTSARRDSESATVCSKPAMATETIAVGAGSIASQRHVTSVRPFLS